MGKDYLGKDMRRAGGKGDKEEEEKEFKALDEGDIKLLKTYGQGQYSRALKAVETDITDISKRVNELAGIKESDTGLAPPALWDLAADKQTLQSEQPLQVARCTKIINADSDDPKYIINVKQFAKFVVDLADQVRFGLAKSQSNFAVDLSSRLSRYSTTICFVANEQDLHD